MKYDKYAEHTFLNPKTVREMQDVGIDMCDAVYFLTKEDDGTWNVYSKGEIDKYPHDADKILPTYTLPDLLYKLNEYPYVGDIGCPLEFIKDAPFYIFGYYFMKEGSLEERKKVNLESIWETPLMSAAKLLIMCHKRGIWYAKGIGDKYDEVY